MNTQKRAASESLDKILGQTFPILDHGFIRVIDYMGNDSRIVQAARVSYGDGTKTINEDKGLINYLVKNKHSSPLEMNEITFHIKAPVFIARQWLRHRTANVNEISARYSVIKDEFYLPDVKEVRMQSKTNKQCSSQALEVEIANQVLEALEKTQQQAYDAYLDLINNKGVAREIARSILPQGTYTEFYWKIDLHNLLHFLRLRNHTHAQKEIQVYAKQICEVVKLWCPLTYEAFESHVLQDVHFSQKQLAIYTDMIKAKLHNQDIISQEQSRLSKSDYQAVLNQINYFFNL